MVQYPKLVKLIGYCVDGDQRLLVYEFRGMINHQDENIPDRPRTV